jgi:hypothetical protein
VGVAAHPEATIVDRIDTVVIMRFIAMPLPYLGPYSMPGKRSPPAGIFRSPLVLVYIIMAARRTATVGFWKVTAPVHWKNKKKKT